MSTIGSSPLAQQFYAGRYAEIVASDFEASEAAAHDVAFVIGALTFVDRVDEAHGLFASWSAHHADARTIAASRFFLGLAAARAGYFDRAFGLLVREAFRDRHHVDAWVRAFVFQGLAAQCYFTGRYPGAARHALRALQAAHEARFPYVAMLGTDMRGHSLVQLGQLQRGIAMLEQAGKQARRLGLANNELAVETSIATYVTKFDPHLVALERVEGLLRRRAHDSYSRRALLTEAAIRYAMRGRRTDAIEALDAAERDALRGDTRRGRVASLIARLWVTRWQHGAAACRELVDQAALLVEPRDVAFRAQLLGFDILVARDAADIEREQHALDELRGLWKESHHFTAKAALAQYAAARTIAFDEDAVTPILRSVAQRDVSALARIASLGVVGVIPELLGLQPGKRIIVIPSEDLLLLEDHGNVIVRERPPRWCPLLLRVLASGDATKEKIVAGLWGLRTYHPDLHDPPVRTTIHRLRSFLAPYGSWIEVGEGGYRTTVPVHLVSNRELAIEPAPLWDESEAPHLDVPREPSRHSAEPLADDPKQRLLRHFEDHDRASVPELAKALELSASTVLRALRELVDAKLVERHGFARATRYARRAAMQ